MVGRVGGQLDRDGSFERSYKGRESSSVPCDLNTEILKRLLMAFNIFYNLPSLAPPTASELCDKLDQYLSTDPKNVKDALLWWHEKRHTFPKLSCMALDYLLVSGVWSLQGYVRDSDVKAVTSQEDIAEGEEESDLEDGWDAINV
ncbi:hypothetical protein D9613_009167 [Agrocybe pediades]|uniref:HAT C-terminal dimerisation domain-containing protein n=1 Tax=Agrocybe pediades TaxID=84607 RepID=A0A8H4R341_9AGAR|nr:hypothetical protein D9613_009167 [Agrocybe pediades]